MKVSRQQVETNRRRILDAAGHLFREKGFEAVTVAEVMKAAGLTHGGFYGHFKSKDDLIAQTLAHLLSGTIPAQADLASYAKAYLTPARRDDLAHGCPMAGLASESSRQSPEARDAMAEGLRRQIKLLSRNAPGDTVEEKRQAATGSWAAMVGAMILSRLSNDPALADEVLADTSAWIGARSGG